MLRHPDDAVHRRTNLVTHGRDELALEARCANGFLKRGIDGALPFAQQLGHRMQRGNELRDFVLARQLRFHRIAGREELGIARDAFDASDDQCHDGPIEKKYERDPEHDRAHECGDRLSADAH